VCPQVFAIPDNSKNYHTVITLYYFWLGAELCPQPVNPGPGESFCFETVFSHESKIDFIAMAKAHGYTVILIYIHLTDPSLNEARVFQRTLEGGYDVPAEKIHSRIPKTMKNIQTVLPVVDEAWILDNSSGQNRFQQIAIIKKGFCEKQVDPLPAWVMDLLL
jgi:predicted ABC-type ATPase